MDQNKISYQEFREATKNFTKGFDNVKSVVEKDVMITSFAEDSLNVIDWDILVNTTFNEWLVLDGQGVRFKRICHASKECYFITEMDPDLSDKEYAYFGYQFHNCKEIGEIVYGHLIELVENRKEYVEGDVFIYPIDFKHKPISYVKSRYGVEFINPNKEL